jgi:hypothetical protein
MQMRADKHETATACKTTARFADRRRANAAPKKKQKRPDAQRQYQIQRQTPSLDGRITGRTRTCWFETLQYDGFGVPYGPYCH